MKNMFAFIFAVTIAMTFAGCTKVEKPFVVEPSTEDQIVVPEDVTEKEELVPLLFSDETADIYLYGIKPEGVILYADGAGHYFDWQYKCSDYRAPVIHTGYFDNDSAEDFAVVTYTKNDGISVEDIRFITDGDFSEDNVYLVDETELDSYVSYNVSESFANNSITFSCGDENYSSDLSDSFETLAYDGVSYCENVSYEFADGNIYVNIIPVVSSADEDGDYGKAAVDLTIRAKLNFDGYNISLSDFELKLTGI